MCELRQEEFHLGHTHGKVKAQNDASEAHLQRSVFLLGSATFEFPNNGSQLIRWAGYEMPLYRASRGKAIDLIGYDSSFNVYLVELKKGSSSHSLAKTIQQINEYADLFEEIRANVQSEFRATFFHDAAEFGEVRRVILAPKRYYDNNLADMPQEQGNIAFTYFSRLQERMEPRLLERKSPLSLSIRTEQPVLPAWWA